MNARKEKIVAMLAGGVESLLRKNGVETIRGRGRLVDRRTIQAQTADGVRRVQGKSIIIATGSEPLKPSGFAFDGRTVLTSDDALRMTAAPASVLIVGGGYIGCEWAGILGGLGAQVAIVEMMDQLLPRSDADIAKELLKHFKKSKMDVHLKTKVESIQTGSSGVKAKLSNGKEVEAQVVLVCVGRSLNSKDIGLEALGIVPERDAIPVDESCQTSVAGVYAIGDVTGKLMLAHVASRQGIVAAEHAAGREARMNYGVVPSCVFTEPEIGSVGLTAAEAQAKGIEVKEARFPFQTLGKAHAMGEPTGFLKILADAKTGEVLGAHIIGAHATDLIAEAALAMSLESTVEEIAQTIHAHPTLAEGMMECAHAWLGHLIHG
jgi:dihydrolipoamide dehydrogenase